MDTLVGLQPEVILPRPPERALPDLLASVGPLVPARAQERVSEQVGAAHLPCKRQEMEKNMYLVRNGVLKALLVEC